MQVHPPEQIYIKATMSDSSSVIMAEAAALALAAAVTETLNVHHINFLSDNQQLVHFFNGSDGSNPPNWRIKHLTQSFINHTKEKKYRALQGSRSLVLKMICSASFFSRNSVFFSQQFSRNSLF